MLVIVLAILSATNLATSLPISHSMCQKYNSYTWELFSFLLQKPDDLKACERMITEKSQNLKYCSSNSIQILNFFQRDYYLTTASISGSGAQPETTSSNKCLLEINFSFSKGTILGGDIALYKHVQSNDNFEIIVYNRSRDESIIGSTTVNGEKTPTGWNRVEVNGIAGLGVGDHHVQLSVQFIKNGEEISCQEAQNTFITDCTKPEVEELSSSRNHGPALVLISQRESFILRQKRRVARSARDKSTDCTLKRKKISLKHLSNVGKVVSPGEIEIDRCVPRNGGECFPTQTKDLHFITSGNTGAVTSIETISDLVDSQC